jgi:hypothetical protein
MTVWGVCDSEIETIVGKNKTGTTPEEQILLKVQRQCRRQTTDKNTNLLSMSQSGVVNRCLFLL